MKRIFLYTIVLISIPFFIVIIYNKEKKVEHLEEINLNYISNIMVRLKRVNQDRIETINLEKYVEGVVAAEMPALFEEEALKAQAVASRTYALKKLEDNKNLDYDLVDTVQNQVYLDEETLKNKWNDNYIEYINRIRNAINETSLQYLEYNGTIINAMFFSTSNGYTEDAIAVFNEDIPYLKSVKSSWDSKVSQTFQYKTEINLEDFYKKLGLKYNKKVEIEIIDKSITNRISKIKINNKEFTGKEIYEKLGLRSTDFNISQKENIIIIETKGYGHGVGMSQYGAQGMALEGYKYDEILSHYYTNTQIKKLEN